MRYRILGTDPETKQELALIVDAPTAAEAEKLARAKGISIVSTEPEPAGTPEAGESEKPAPKPGGSTQGANDDDELPRVVLTMPVPGSVQTIELTAKPWKAILFFGAFLMILGLLGAGWAIVSDPRSLTNPPLLVYLGAGAFVGGLLVFIVGRLGAWWYHG